LLEICVFVCVVLRMGNRIPKQPLKYCIVGDMCVCLCGVEEPLGTK